MQNPTNDHQVVGSLWQGNYLLAVGLNGYIYYLDEANPNKPLRVLKGHNKFITSFTYDPTDKNFYTGSYDGIIHRWVEGQGSTDGISGTSHSNEITGASIDPHHKQVFTCGKDDTVRVTSTESKAQTGISIGTTGLPVGIASPQNNAGCQVVATSKGVGLIRKDKVVAFKNTTYDPTCIAFAPDGTQAAVGAADNIIHLFQVDGDTLKETGELKHHRGALTSISYSPDGSMIASGDSNREVVAWDRNAKTVKCQGWVFHTSRVKSVAWSPDNKYVASASLDQSVIIWSIEKPTSRIQQKIAHHMGTNGVTWVDNNTLASIGQDCTLKTWTVKF